VCVSVFVVQQRKLENPQIQFVEIQVETLTYLPKSRNTNLVSISREKPLSTPSSSQNLTWPPRARVSSVGLPNPPSSTQEITRKIPQKPSKSVDLKKFPETLISNSQAILQNPKQSSNRFENYLRNLALVETRIGDPSLVLHSDAIFEEFPLLGERLVTYLLVLQHVHQAVEDLTPFSAFGGDIGAFFRAHSVIHGEGNDTEGHLDD
jgi:hypothetical protein